MKRRANGVVGMRVIASGCVGEGICSKQDFAGTLGRSCGSANVERGDGGERGLERALRKGDGFGEDCGLERIKDVDS